MLEMLIRPRKAERKPWEMFFVGLFYATLSLLLVNWIFSQDAVLAKRSSILIITFTVMFSMPFIYYTLRLEETRAFFSKGTLALLYHHRRAIYAFIWLFMGFVVSYSIWYMIFPSSYNFDAQIETYCMINRPANFEQCVSQYGNVQESNASVTTGFLTNPQRFLLIFTNNLYVLLFTLLFSLLFGAGAIFILAWNASVIAAAIGIFSNSNVLNLPIGLARFMIHGIPEIASYFIVALAGGMISIAVIKHDLGTEGFWKILHDSINLVLIAVGVLILAALIEVYFTPVFF